MGWKNHKPIEGNYSFAKTFTWMSRNPKPKPHIHISYIKLYHTISIRLSRISLPNKLYHTIHGIKCHRPGIVNHPSLLAKDCDNQLKNLMVKVYMKTNRTR